MSNQEKKDSRHLELLLFVFLVLTVVTGALYVLHPGFREAVRPHPCILNEITGLMCPSCGGTRAFSHLLRGNIVLALRYNPLAIMILPLAVYVGAVMTRIFLDSRRSLVDVRVSPFWIWLIFFLVVLFSLVRNMPLFNYLWYPL